MRNSFEKKRWDNYKFIAARASPAAEIHKK